MGSATIRRFALVAAMVLLAPVWFRPSVVVRAVPLPGAIVAGLPSDGTPASPAIRRHNAGGWAMAGTRFDHARRLLALGVVALLSLLIVGPWSILESRRSAPSPLARRRHAIALRAPPLPSCA